MRCRRCSYYFGGHWKLAHKGAPPIYYLATDNHGGGSQVPELSWKGQMPYPRVMCQPGVNSEAHAMETTNAMSVVV